MERTYLWIFDDRAQQLDLKNKLTEWVSDEGSPTKDEEKMEVLEYGFNNYESDLDFEKRLENDKEIIKNKLKELSIKSEEKIKIIVLLDYRLYAGSNSSEYSKQRRELVVKTLREGLNNKGFKDKVNIFIFLYTTVEHDNLENYIYDNEKELAKGFLDSEVPNNFKVYDRGVSFDFSDSPFYYGRLDVVYNASKKRGGDIWLKAQD